MAPEKSAELLVAEHLDTLDVSQGVNELLAFLYRHGSV
jgi:hypothetical protein